MDAVAGGSRRRGRPRAPLRSARPGAGAGDHSRGPDLARHLPKRSRWSPGRAPWRPGRGSRSTSRRPRGIGPLYDQLHELYAEGLWSPGLSNTSGRPGPELACARGTSHQLIVTTGYGHASRVPSEWSVARRPTSFLFPAVGPTAESSSTDRRTARRQWSRCRTRTESSHRRNARDPQAHGGVDRRSERGESFVVSEDDYIGYLAQSELANVLPVTLRIKLRRRSHLLFISYSGRRMEPARLPAPCVWRPADQLSLKRGCVARCAYPLQHELWRQSAGSICTTFLSDDFVADLGAPVAQAAR